MLWSIQISGGREILAQEEPHKGLNLGDCLVCSKKQRMPRMILSGRHGRSGGNVASRRHWGWKELASVTAEVNEFWEEAKGLITEACRPQGRLWILFCMMCEQKNELICFNFTSWFWPLSGELNVGVTVEVGGCWGNQNRTKCWSRPAVEKWLGVIFLRQWTRLDNGLNVGYEGKRKIRDGS